MGMRPLPASQDGPVPGRLPEIPARALLTMRPGVARPADGRAAQLVQRLQTANYPTDSNTPRQVAFYADQATGMYRITLTLNGRPVDIGMVSYGQGIGLYVEHVVVGSGVGRTFDHKLGMIVLLMRPCVRHPSALQGRQGQVCNGSSSSPSCCRGWLHRKACPPVRSLSTCRPPKLRCLSGGDHTGPRCR